jgi:carbamoyl-phosphate synthase large subunit
LKASKRDYYVAGTDFSKYYIEFPDVNERYLTPKHDDPTFVSRVSAIARKERADFIHPQPSSEALVLSSHRKELPAPVLLPPQRVMDVAHDKQQTHVRLRAEGIPVAGTKIVRRVQDLKAAFKEMRPPLWVRARHGAGGRLSLMCKTAAEAENWIELWVRKGTPISEFMIQEYLPGRNVAWDSIWKDGELITSYCRERLEYPFKHITPSGITGTPSVARSIHDKRVDRIAENAVRAISPKPSGAFSIDVKEDSDGRPRVTEVDAGKFHTTMPLWGYVALRHLKLPWYSNLADLYVRLGLGEEVDGEVPRYDLIPSGYYMIRNIDSGVLLWREDGWKEKVL